MKKVVELNIDNFIPESQNGWLTITNKDNNIISNLKCFKNSEEINILDVRNIHLYKLHKSIFFNLTKLQILDIRDNKLMNLSKSIFYLRNLKVLRLDNNQLDYLPIEIGKLYNLETLTLNYNNLNKLPSTLKDLINLKVLKLSFNKINRLDVDIGHLKSLETLHIDSNYFSEIPTTIYHLKHLSDFSLEWLEYLDPPFQKLVKDNIGQTIISLIKMSLYDLLKENLLYCDFITFVEKNSTKKNQIFDQNSQLNNDISNEISKKLPSPKKENINNNPNQASTSNEVIKTSIINNKESLNNTNTNTLCEINREGNMIISLKNLQKLFFIIENNYYGVLKSLLNHNKDYLNLKNIENKNILYLALHHHKFEMIDLILSKVNISFLSSPHIYLHKSIKLRDPILTIKMLMHVDPNYCDDEGNNAFHILFSSFYKNHTKCSLIGDRLLEYNCKPNFFNDNLMSPIHIAIKKGTTECLEWILMQNKNLLREGKEIFDINIKGKNGITCLHLAVSLNKVQEILLLLENGADVFSKTVDKKSALKLHKGNFFIAKILRNQENHIMESKYNYKSNLLVLNIQNNYTTIEEVSNVEDLNSLKKTILYNTIQTDKDYSKINSPILYKINSNVMNNRMIEEISKDYKNCNEQEDENTSPVKLNENQNNSNQKVFNNSPSINAKPRNTIKYETPKFKSNNNFMNLNLQENLRQSKGNSYNVFKTSEKKSFRKQTYQNISYYKDIILNPLASLAEKYESLMNIKLIFNRKDIENILRIIIEGLNLESDIDDIIFLDICMFLISAKLIGFSDLVENKVTSSRVKQTTILEVKNALILLSLNDNKNTYRVNEFNNKGIKTLIKTMNSPTKLFNDQVVFKIPNLNFGESFISENSCASYDLYKERNEKDDNENDAKASRNDNKKNKQQNRPHVLICGENHTVDEYNHEEMNEINKNNLESRMNNQNMPKKLLKEINQKRIDFTYEIDSFVVNSDSSRTNVKLEKKKSFIPSKDRAKKHSSTLSTSKFFPKDKK